MKFLVGTGDGERVVKRLVGNVGKVHDHPQTVHLADHLFAEIRQAVVHRRVSR